MQILILAKASSNCLKRFKDDKDGKLDWDKMDDNDIAKNADGLTEYIGIGNF